MNKLFLVVLLNTYLFSASYYEYGKKVELTPYTYTQSSSLAPLPQNHTKNLRYFKNKNAQIIGVDDTIIAKCLHQRECESTLQAYPNIEYKSISKNTYLITVGEGEDIFETSVKLYEMGTFKYVQPNFYRQRELR